ncbi:MAG: endonuclease/exonuclease/phosphatase family protein [Crocinitomicaceae bacterium]
MKKTLIIGLSLMTFFGCEMAEQDFDNLDMIEQDDSNETHSEIAGRSIVFYNVENLFDTENDPHTDDDDFTPHGDYQWDEDRYETKLDRISEAINLIEERPVIIGLSEIENYKVLEDLIDEDGMDDINYGIVHYNSPDRRGIDCGFLYDKDAFEVIDKEKIPVTLSYNRNFKTRDIIHVFGEFTGGVEAHIFVNHWSSRREGKEKTEHKRLEAAETLREKIDDILADNPDANIIILGDFNDHPDDDSLEEVLRAKESGFADEGDLINLLYDNHANGEGTSVHQRDWACLDQIIVSQSVYDNNSGLGIVKNESEILREKELIYTYQDGGQKPSSTYGGRKYYGGYSDHLPVYIILK